MRYQNWDVLMFPQELCKIPVQEFKTSCQVIQDPGECPHDDIALQVVQDLVAGRY
jgi:hypothetical protein